jgi:diacylglycerol kinase family enzyme
MDRDFSLGHGNLSLSQTLEMPRGPNLTPSAIHPVSTADHVLISVNPRAGRAPAHERIRPIEEAIAAAGFHVEVATEREQVADLAEQWQSEGRLRAVLAAGGDGTVSGLLNIIPAEAPVLPLPMGTANLLAGYVGQAAPPVAVVETLRHGVGIRMDAGRANGRLFLLMISAGFDAEVVRHMHANREGHITQAAYLKPIFNAIRNYTYPEMRLYLDEAAGSTETTPCRWVFASNLPSYACGFRFSPEAVGTDGQLDICTFRRGSLWHGLRYLMHVILGSHVELSDVTMAQRPSFRLESLHGHPVTYQLDGDTGGYLPVDVDVVPSRVTLLVSKKTAQRLGFVVPS